MKPSKELHGPSKKALAVGILAVLLLLFAVIKIVPMLGSFLISFKSYSLAGGIGNSPWIGLQNYQKFISSYGFSGLIRNSILLNAAGLLLNGLVAFGLAQLVLHVESPRLARIATGLLALPAFLPNAAYISVMFSLFGVPSGDHAAVTYVMQYLAVDGIKNGFLAGFMGALCGRAAMQRGKRPVWGAAAGIGACLLFRFSSLLTPDAELSQLMSNPESFSFSDIFDTYQYRTGLLNSDYSFSGAVWMTKNLLQILPAILAAVLLVVMLRQYFRYLEHPPLYEENAGANGQNGFGVAAIALSLAIPVFFTAVNLVTSRPSSGESVSMEALWGMAGYSLVITILATITFGVVTLLLAFSLSKLFNGVTITVFLFLSTILNNTTGEYLFYRSAGMVNTFLPIILGNLFKISFVFLLAFLVNQKTSRMETLSLMEYFRLALPCLIVFMGLFASNIWGGDRMQVVYLNRIQSIYAAAVSAGMYQVVQLMLLIPSLLLGGICITGFVLADKSISQDASSQ